jgi:hypothetical protein
MLISGAILWRLCLWLCQICWLISPFTSTHDKVDALRTGIINNTHPALFWIFPFIAPAHRTKPSPLRQFVFDHKVRSQITVHFWFILSMQQVKVWSQRNNTMKTN